MEPGEKSGHGVWIRAAQKKRRLHNKKTKKTAGSGLPPVLPPKAPDGAHGDGSAGRAPVRGGRNNAQDGIERIATPPSPLNLLSFAKPKAPPPLRRGRGCPAAGWEQASFKDRGDWIPYFCTLNFEVLGDRFGPLF